MEASSSQETACSRRKATRRSPSCVMRSLGVCGVPRHVTSSETAVMNALRAPVVALKGKGRGTISDAHERELVALQEVWPEVPHQVCPFPALRDASKKACEADTQVNTAMRTRVHPKVREVRTPIKKHLTTASPPEAAQRAVLGDDATGIVTALTTDGLHPCQNAPVEPTAMVDAIDASVQQLAQQGDP
jgi:hypothetical protein